MYVTPGWLAENVNVALTAVVVSGASGTLAVIVVSAGPTTVQVKDTGVGSTFRLGSTARTRSLCTPGSRPPNSAMLSGAGPAHDSYTGTPIQSSAHSNDTPGSGLEKVKSEGRSMLISAARIAVDERVGRRLVVDRPLPDRRQALDEQVRLLRDDLERVRAGRVAVTEREVRLGVGQRGLAPVEQCTVERAAQPRVGIVDRERGRSR